MALRLYRDFFPEKAERETRSLSLCGHADRLDDDYGLVEYYCTATGCDCRRVLLMVVSRRRQEVVAWIAFGFDPKTEGAGAELDPLNPQSDIAPYILQQVCEHVLSDPEYVARIERHYAEVKSLDHGPAPDPIEELRRFALGRARKPRRRGV